MISLRTGERSKDGKGKEILCFTEFRDKISNKNLIKITISFPGYNKNTEKTFWMFAETSFGKDTAREIIVFLEEWPDKNTKFNTGETFSESISFTSCVINQENEPGKKIRILVPETKLTKKKIGFTKINSENSKKVVQFLKEYVGKDIINRDEIEILKTQIQKLNDKIDHLSKKLDIHQNENNTEQFYQKSWQKGGSKTARTQGILTIKPVVFIENNKPKETVAF